MDDSVEVSVVDSDSIVVLGDSLVVGVVDSSGVSEGSRGSNGSTPSIESAAVFRTDANGRPRVGDVRPSAIGDSVVELDEPSTNGAAVVSLGSIVVDKRSDSRGPVVVSRESDGSNMGPQRKNPPAKRSNPVESDQISE